MFTHPVCRLFGFVVLNLALLNFACAQGVVTVGPPNSGCDKTSLQEGINALIHNTDVIHVRQGYVSPPILINNKQATIIGGFPDCSLSSSPDFSQPTALNALLSTDDQAVIRITGHAVVQLQNLVIGNGHNPSGKGGGISFNGITGCSPTSICLLEMNHVQITSNSAQYGGGIYANGPSSSFVKIDDNTLIDHNFASGGGGGIRLEGSVKMTAASPQTTINNNVANPNNVDDGRGGGIQALDSTVVDIASPGYNGAAVIDSNHARYGGGLSIHDSAVVQLSALQTGSPARIENNDASQSGGGVFLRPQSGGVFGTNRFPYFCGFGAGINHNSAQNGAAIYGDTDGDAWSSVFFSTGSSFSCSISGSVSACPIGSACNTVNDNTATQTNGSIISLQQDGQLVVERTELRRNTASHVHSGTRGDATFLNCLIAQNDVSAAVINSPFALVMLMDGCTVTDNAISLSGVPVFGGDMGGTLTVTLLRSIVWQPGKNTFDSSTAPSLSTLKDDILTDAAALDPATFQSFVNVQGADPAFVDAVDGNYQLTHLSPAIDNTNTCAPSGDVDLVSNERRIFLREPISSCDIGAYERQKFPQQAFPNDENFEEVDPFARELPTGWTHSIALGDSAGWSVTSFLPHTGTFAAVIPNAHSVSDSRLESPSFVGAASEVLTFWHQFDVESQYDAVVLDISINGAPYQDILSAGGSFVSGGYNSGLLPGATPNPIQAEDPGRLAWTGGSGGYQQVTVNLPASINGKAVRLRWRSGTDGNGYRTGYWLDDVHIEFSDEIFGSGFEGS